MEKATVVQRATLVATLAMILALVSEKSLPKQGGSGGATDVVGNPLAVDAV